MAIQATYIAPLVTATTTAVDVALAIRVTLNSDGLVAASDIGVRGDYMTIQSIPASTAGEVASLQAGIYVPATASEACAVGDVAYSAASGKVSKSTGGGAVLLGKWTVAASGDGVIGQVLLGNPA